MKPGRPMRRTGLKRGTGIRQCGQHYATRADALASPEAEAGGFVPRVKSPCGSFHVRATPARKNGIVAVRAAAAPRAPKPRPKPGRVGAATGLPKPPSGFSEAVRLAIKTRAGDGDIDAACCEACAIWLGPDLGEIQHRVARGSGGCRDSVINGPANGAYLCPSCHRDCESRNDDTGMEAAGFRIKHGVTPEFDPRYVPIAWHVRADVTGLRWLGEDGSYLGEAPGLAVAA